MTDPTADTREVPGLPAHLQGNPNVGTLPPDGLTPSRHSLPNLEALGIVGDPLGQLTVPELRVVNSALSRSNGQSIDVADAITRPTEFRWDAMAYLGWVLEKRSNPQAKLAVWMAATADELTDAITPSGPAADADEVDPSQADGSEALPPPMTADELDELATADPTGPTG